MLAGLVLVASQADPAGGGGSAPALAAVVHKSCGLDNVSTTDLRKMLLGDLRIWQDSRPIVLIEQPDESVVQQRMLRVLLRTDPAGYKRQLLAIQFQGNELPIIKILSADDNAIKFVWNLPGAIAVVDATTAAANSARVKVLRIDGKVPGEPGYPLQ